MSQLTSAQQRAVLADGNVLVEAGAGTGKTRTLVERCLARLADPQAPVSLKEMVIVTFTEAAAAEMRQRLRAALEKLCLAQPGNQRLEEQLASLDSAWISTLHGFCYGLAREHFHELELDPQFTILTDSQTKVLAQEVLDAVFRQPEHAARMRALHQWSRERGQTGRQRLRDQVLRLYHYSRALRDPQAWLQTQLNALANAEPKPWLEAWEAEIPRWAGFWREALGASGSPSLITFAAYFAWPERLNLRTESAAWLERVRAAIPPKKGAPKAWENRLKNLSGELEFLLSLTMAGEGAGSEADWPALREDWEWTRPAMAELLRLAQAFAAEFQRRKQELGGVDFSDLEHFALRVLWDAEQRQLRPAAEVWRQRTKLLFIDEYQDINEAQDAILECLARPDATGNRFLVGDVKQSIYQFRLANPRIFLGYAKTWGQPGAAGQVLRLTENFRSHPAILEFANRFFTGLMRESAGGVDYSAETALQPGDPSHPRFQAAPAGPLQPRVALHLLLADEGEEEDSPEASGLSAAESEARLMGQQLLALRQQAAPVWDEAASALRPVEWRDMAILLRAPRGQAEVIAKEFARLGIPLGASRTSFFEAIETADWLNLLRLLDNPFQDLPLLAVLRSPLAHFTTEDLAQLRLAGRACPLWTALQALARAKKPETASAKARQFLQRHARWRQMARVTALSDCLAAMLDETLYEAWLSLQPRAAQRLANIRQLLEIARQFDQFQRQGLFRFLRFVEAQIDAEAGLEAAAPETGNAVRLISIHHSKGLEFPVVVVAGLAKKFNDQDLHGPLILDQQLGLCPMVRAPQEGAKYPSLAHWFARRRQRQELAGEEMRLLYVAMTRARDYLLLTGRVKLNKIGEWAELAGQPLSLLEVTGARSCLDWAGPRCAALVPGGDLSVAGQTEVFAWQIHAASSLQESPENADAKVSDDAQGALTPADIETLRDRLAWLYPHLAATKEPGKTSVSAWRKRMLEETHAEAYPLFADEPSVVDTAAGAAKAPATLAATDIGTIHHRFLEWVAFGKTNSQSELAAEADRLVTAAVLTPEERAALDMPALWSFWNSPLGQQVRAQGPQVRRELPFTARFTPEELRGWVAGQLPPLEASEAGDFIIVQGVVDLAVILERELWVVDYKTGEVRPEDLDRKARAYAPQLALYATALARIYRRPATQCWLHFLMPGQSVNVTALNLL